ncbi:zinc-binding dehydrogenase [Rhodococcus sp. (in: high G+C Gram-positive bacteria)]|uniref:zinc-binding dehydrogenase n=1 Tax=Rhodococcus sp. TaxID=1831 RepID=UPI00257A3E79|nr:zinc-binding dehydrogenase [Rhodococcus sp. (in: high G+C Gram-positive bacteria)]MBQ7805731.1 zinc-binding dehydrogenase [Rhodococcus sp. (in: high G+C Gram-positive bacteria)]
MKAWQFIHTDTSLELVELHDPKPGPGEVLVAVRACGICHSDVGLFEDSKWLGMMDLPVVPGHEIAGEVVALGPDVTDFTTGDRVVVWSLGEFHGYLKNGGFGQYIVAAAATLVHIPEGVAFDRAVFAEPGMTAHAGVVGAGHVQSGQRVGVIGFGGLGRIGAQIVLLSGAELYVAEVNEDVWESARQIGARRVVRDISELVDVKLDLIVDFAGFGSTTAAAISTVRDRGKVVQIGMGRLDATIDTYQLITKNVTLVGSGGGSKSDMEAVLAWIASGDIEPLISPTDFNGIPDGIAQLAKGEVVGRLVAVY